MTTQPGSHDDPTMLRRLQDAVNRTLRAAQRAAQYGTTHPMEPNQENQMTDQPKTTPPTWADWHHAVAPKVELIQEGGQFMRDTVLIHVRETGGQARAYARVVAGIMPTDHRQFRLVRAPENTDGARLTPEQEAEWGLEVPEVILDALYAALRERNGDNPTQEAYDDLEARLENAISDLDLARAEERERTLERDQYEVLALAKDELIDALRHHLADNSMGLDKEAARADRLEEACRDLQDRVNTLHSAMEAYAMPQRWATGLDPAEVGEFKTQDLGPFMAHTRPKVKCGILPPASLPHAQPCQRDADQSDHRRIGEPRAGEIVRLIHTDGAYAWTGDGVPVSGGNSLKGPNE